MTDPTTVKRRLAAILAADIAGYSRLMGEDEAATVRDLKGHQAAVLPLVAEHGGRVIDTAGDGILAEFASVVEATLCALDIQAVMEVRNEQVPDARRMVFRIGINLGDVIYDDDRIYGDGINVAARLEGLAEPGGILVSRAVYEQVRDRLEVPIDDLGEQSLKNIARPVRVYRVSGRRTPKEDPGADAGGAEPPAGLEQREAGERAANVFLSYARSDETAAAKLVYALEEAGLEVWWDARIEGGAEFARSIEAALDRCDAVVVLWTATSVRSDWVLDEASRGRQQRKLVPVSLDGTPPPLGFGQYQAVKLTGWKGGTKSPEIGALVRGIASVAGHALHQMPDAPPPGLQPPAAPRKRLPLAIGGIAIAVIAAAILFSLMRPAPAPAPGSPPPAAAGDPARDLPAVLDNSIAVLRFVNLDGSEQTQVFSDGLADDLITALSRVPGLFVSSRGDSFTVEPNAGSAKVRERLRVAHYVDGSVEIQGEAMRVMVQLIDSGTGFQVLSRKFDRPLKDFFALRDEITQLTVSNVRVALPADDASLLASQQEATDLDAYVAYRHGKDLYEQPRTLESLAQVVDYYEQALAIDPQYAAAHAGVCDAYVARYNLNNSAADIEAAERACADALADSPRLYMVNTSLGDLYRRTGRLDQAERAYRTALEANPNDVRAMEGMSYVHEARGQGPAAEKLLQKAVATQPGNWRTLNGYGSLLFSQGRYLDAADVFRQAVALEPANYQARGNLGAALSMAGEFTEAKLVYEDALEIGDYPTAYSNLGVLYYYLWDFDRSVATHRKAIELSPNEAFKWVNLADSLHFAGREGEARKAFVRSTDLSAERLAVDPKDADTLFVRAWALHMLGRWEEARDALAKGAALVADDPYGLYYAGLIELRSGEREAALASFRRAIESGYPPKMLAAEPYIGDLRSDPEFQALLAAAPQ
jgi:class 3 adenylate cyclase/tetratricopeptide (TPR) repeat protein